MEAAQEHFLTTATVPNTSFLNLMGWVRDQVLHFCSPKASFKLMFCCLKQQQQFLQPAECYRCLCFSLDEVCVLKYFRQIFQIQRKYAIKLGGGGDIAQKDDCLHTLVVGFNG